MDPYVETLPKFRKRLLAKCNPNNAVTETEALEKFTSAINNHKTIKIASDGGLKNDVGTFGVIVAQGTDNLWECAGPVDGDPTTSNSKRSELAGRIRSKFRAPSHVTPSVSSTTNGAYQDQNNHLAR